MSLQLLLHSHAAICHDASKLDSLSVLRESHSIARKSKQPEDFPVAGEVMGCRPYRQVRIHCSMYTRSYTDPSTVATVQGGAVIEYTTCERISLGLSYATDAESSESELCEELGGGSQEHLSQTVIVLVTCVDFISTRFDNSKYIMRSKTSSITSPIKCPHLLPLLYPYPTPQTQTQEDRQGT